MLARPGGFEPTPHGELGDIIDTYCGVNAYENGDDPWNVQAEGPYGYEWQCTEFAMRFVCEAFDQCDDKGGKHGNAWEWWDNPYNNPNLAVLTRLPNGGDVPPKPGDVLVFDGNPTAGHVSIVREVNLEAGWVRVIQQNCFECVPYYTIHVDDGIYWMKSAVLGWMRPPGEMRCPVGDMPDTPIP